MKRPPPLDGLRDSKSPIPPTRMVSPQGKSFDELCVGKGESGEAGQIVRGVAGRQLSKPRGQLVTTITICCEGLGYPLLSSLE